MDNKEMPVGFAMSLAMNNIALNNYAKLSYETQEQIINFIQNSNTGIEAEEKIKNAISDLEKNSITFLNT